MKFLALVVFEIFMKILVAFDLLPLDKGQRSWHQTKAHNFMVSIIEMKSLSLVVFEIFAKMAF